MLFRTTGNLFIGLFVIMSNQPRKGKTTGGKSMEQTEKIDRAKAEKALAGLLPKINARRLRLLTMIAYELSRKS